MFKVKMISASVRAVSVAVALLALHGTGYTQQKPSPAAVEAAKEIVTLKGGENMFGSLIPGVVEQAKSMFEQQNPALGRDLSTVAAKLRTELAPRMAEVNIEIANAYAAHFTEAELKEMLTFYKSPLGRKMTAEEPKALAQAVSFAQNWAQRFSDDVLARFRAEMKKMGHNL